MSTTRTPLELATNVLLHLNIIAAEETPSPSDSNYVIKRYRDLFEEMSVNDETYWSVNDVPAAIVEPLTQMVALLIMPAFGKPVDPQSMDEGLRILRRRLRRTVNIRSADTATHFEDF
jgi:hypothetical protein